MRAARAVVRKGRRSQCGSRAIAPPWRCYSLSLLCALAEQQQRAKHYFRERGADEALPSGVRVCRSIRAAVFVITFQLRDSADRRHIEHVHLFFSLCKYSTKPPRMIRSQTFESVLANTFVRLARSLTFASGHGSCAASGRGSRDGFHLMRILNAFKAAFELPQTPAFGLG